MGYRQGWCVVLSVKLEITHDDAQAIIEERTGQDVQTPMQWPFTQTTNEEQDIGYRLSEFVVLAV